MSRKEWIDPKTGKTRPTRRVERINDDRIDRVFQAHRLLEAYANPFRAGLPLSQTEVSAVHRAAKILWKVDA